MITRRKLLLGGAGVLAGAALLRPSDKGGAYSSYFANLNARLQADGIDTPSLIVDLDLLDRNIDRVTASVAKGS